jgi:preprotein translocase subunit SecD
MILSLKKISLTGLVAWAIFAIVAGFILYPPRKKIRLGIDLAGGTYITLAVKVEKAVENELQGFLNSLTKQLKREEQIVALSSVVEGSEIVMRFSSPQEAEKALHQVDQQKDIVSIVKNDELRITLSPERIKDIESNAVNKTVDVLRTRLNASGTEEINIFKHGASNVVVELPDVKDPVLARKLIGTPAVLEFKLVEYADGRPASAPTKDELYNMFDGQLPEGTSVYPGEEHGEMRYYVLQNYAEVSGRHLRDSNPIIDSSRGRPEWVISFKLTSDGGARFAELTRQNIGKQLAILIDGKVISAPVINSEIRDQGVITGSRSDKEARETAFLLKSGAFVAPVTFEEERRVGPALGSDSIFNGLLACIIGLLLLLVFSLYYYKMSGLFAFITLLYNLLVVIVVMSLFKATLTLPGIAGLALTVGMAIDSSILIYERIKELLNHGEPLAKAIKNGFTGAAVVILDANVTHFIVGVVMFYLGAGPIRGFAVTLIIGILSTLITGFFFLRAIFDYWLSRGIKKLSI